MASYKQFKLRRWSFLVGLLFVLVFGFMGAKLIFFSQADSPSLSGDLNNDCVVNTFDLSILLSHWLQTGTGNTEDLNHDGVVNTFDLSTLLSHYGKSCSNLPTNTALPYISGIATVGQTLNVDPGQWDNNPVSYSYQWQACNIYGTSCSNISNATSSSYALGASQAGETVDVVVTAVNADGSAQATSVNSGIIQSSGSPTIVGASGEPNVSCSTTLNPGADVNSALAAASPGSVVCLNSGTWSAITLNGIAPTSPGVTLAATPSQTVVVPGITITGTNTQNLTIEGFSINQPGANGNNNGIQLMCGISGGVIIRYNTIQNQPNGYGVYAYADNCGSGHIQSGVTLEYNQIDHIATGVEVSGGIGEEFNWTIAHNVIGPSINYQGYGHYMEVGGVSGIHVDNNAFEGPQYWNVDSDTTSHLNVLHIFSGGTNVTFNNNLMWHTDSRAQGVLIADEPLANITMDNNLSVEDPICETDSNCFTSSFYVEAAHGLSFLNNTSVNGAWGTALGRVISGDTYTDPQNMVIENNIGAPVSGDTGSSALNYQLWTCTSLCTAPSNNVSSDSSANTVLGGSGNIVNWSPSWQDTTWTPTAGSPWSPPPLDYYKPSGIASTYGYQGEIGP